jgi:hypothetical protein
MQYVNPIVARVSPNLYAAAKTAGLAANEITQVEQMSYTIDQHRKLVKLDSTAARSQYDKLDNGIQEQLKFMFKDAEYLKAPPSAGDAAFGILKTAGTILASPLIGLFKLGGQYNKLINQPYKVARAVNQGADLFSTKTWTDAWDGRSSYDLDALEKTTNYFGKYDVEVAKGLLAGKTPGEIVQAYGTVDNNILQSIKKAFNEPDAFKEVLDGVKYAQVSPGRDIARMLDNKPPADGGLYGSYVSSSTKNISGVLDFVYQIAIDPLTWVSGGTSKLLTKGDRIANQILAETNRGVPAERAVENAFKNPKVYNLWENQLGPILKEFKAGNAEQKAIAYRKIQENHPGMANPQIIKLLTKTDTPVQDAKTAMKFFEDAGNLQKMISGRVDGMTYFRTGITVARTNRLMMDGLLRNLDGVFNFRRTAEELTPAMENINKALVSSEDAISRLKNGDIGMGVILEANKSIKGWKRIGLLASRSAAGLEVRTGEQAVLTASNFTARARQLLPRDMAEAMTQRFLASTEDEQFVILRNLDAAAMYSMGLGGHPKGDELIAKILSERYGDKSGFNTTVERRINPKHSDALPESMLKRDDNGIITRYDGPNQPYQATRAVGSLPYNEIGSMIWEIKSKKNLVNAIGGATQGDHAKKIVDGWSILTLLPRLGIRSAIDEATMYVLTAPGNDLLKFALRQGNRMGTVSKTFTGSDAATGPIKKGVQKLFKIKPESDIMARLGKAININPEEAFSISAREDAILAYAEKIGTDVGLLSSMEKREAVAEHVANIYARDLDPETMGYLLQAFKHSPDALNSMAQSLVAHSALSGKYGKDVAEAIIDKTWLDRALESMDLKMSATKRQLLSSRMTERQIVLAQFEKWVKIFVGNKAKINDQVYLNPGKIFFENNGLETAQDFTRALDQAMLDVGFKINPLTSGWQVDDFVKVKHFRGLSSNSVIMRDSEIKIAESARIQLSNMFIDMNETFHGSGDGYNKVLMNLVSKMKSQLDTLGEASGRRATWNDAAAGISLDNFHDATAGYRISGTINSAIDFDNMNAENVFKRFGNQAMQAMDNQITGLFRQPAIMVTYTQLRKKYKGLEDQFAKQQYKAIGGAWENAGVAKNKSDWEYAKTLAEKHFTEVATRDAADMVLKFADNPLIRSNFSFSARTVGRYYRATEDFYRRIYRMKDVSPRVLYRMRLSHVGLDASGMTHEDQNGEPYIIMPMDNIIFKATDTTIRALTGNLGYSQPNFNEFTLKLRMMNPSFSQDAGLPTLSGPIAGLGVIAVKNFIGTVPGKIPFIGDMIDAPAKQLAENVDTFALGNIGDNIDIVRATVPAGLQRIYAMLSDNEKNRQEVTAAQQAIAYNAAHGRFLDPNSTEQEKSDYLKNIRISAHNVLFLRNFLGLIGPVAPSLMESKGLPDYIKDTGITGLRSEFFDILNGIAATSKGDVQDPYELALATFTGDNPGKLIYTVSRDDKQSKVVIRNTDQLKSWGIANASMIKKYGEAAYIFAPQVGEFNASTYNWIQAAGLVKSKSLEKYYDDLMVSQDKQTYYDIGRKEKEMLGTVTDLESRANIIDAATGARNALKSANPLLKPALIGQGYNIGGEEILMNKVEQIIADPSSNVDAGTRIRMQTAIKMMRNYIAFATDPSITNLNNDTELKAQRKLQIEADLKNLMLGDLNVTEAYRAIFSSILNFYSRDSYAVQREGK